MIGEKRRKRRMTHELLCAMRKNGAGRYHTVPGLSGKKYAGAAGTAGGGGGGETETENQKALDYFRRSRIIQPQITTAITLAITTM